MNDETGRNSLAALAYKKETGEDAYYADDFGRGDRPDLDYVEWLEKKAVGTLLIELAQTL